MKKLVILLLVLMMLISLTACTKGNENEIALLQAQLNQLQNQLNEKNDAPASAPAVQEEQVQKQYIYLFNALADGKDCVEFAGQTTLTARAVIPEGMALEAWARDGVVLEGYALEETLVFNADATTVVEARMRPEKTVTTVNAQMKFLNEKDEPKGEAFEEFVFEKEYLNPVTGDRHEGGTITVYVEAVVPKGYVIDYWKINDIPYHYNRTVSSFTVVELDETTVYEAVLREEKATPTPKPTKAPTAAPAPTPEIADPQEDWKPTPEPTPEPVYYQVTCVDCTFDGKSSGLVPAGTRISVKGNISNGDFEVNDSKYAQNTNSISLTIDEDTYILFIGDIN